MIFKGDESVQYFIKVRSGKHIKTDRIYKEKSMIDKEFGIFKFEGDSAKIGNFNFPFRIDIPNSRELLPTFKDEEYNYFGTHYCQIKYQLKAYIPSSEPDTELYSSKPVIIGQGNIHPPESEFENKLSQDFQINKCSCISAGLVNLSLSQDKAVYFADDDIKVETNVIIPGGNISLNYGSIVMMHVTVIKGFPESIVQNIDQIVFDDVRKGQREAKQYKDIPLGDLKDLKTSINATYFDSFNYLVYQYIPLKSWECSSIIQLTKEVKINSTIKRSYDLQVGMQPDNYRIDQHDRNNFGEYNEENVPIMINQGGYT